MEPLTSHKRTTLRGRWMGSRCIIPDDLAARPQGPPDGRPSCHNDHGGAWSAACAGNAAPRARGRSRKRRAISSSSSGVHAEKSL